MNVLLILFLTQTEKYDCCSVRKNNVYTISIINDGEKPKGVIVEGGGLTGLRSLVERENGKMTLKSTPHFELLIELSQGEKI